MRKDVSYLRVYASNEPRIGIVRTAMGACAQIAVFTYAVIRRTPRYEIRLAAPFADNLMNSVAHCGEVPINVERPPVPFLSPQRGHRRQEQASLYPSSASTWAQETGTS